MLERVHFGVKKAPRVQHRVLNVGTGLLFRGQHLAGSNIRDVGPARPWTPRKKWSKIIKKRTRTNISWDRKKCWTQQGAVWKKRDPYKHYSSDVGPEWVLGSTSREMEISETDPYKHLFRGPTRTNISKILKKRHPYKHFKSWARICWSREMLGPRCG